MADGSKKESINKKECVLYVPRQSVSFYRNEMYWGDFTHIEPLPYDIYALLPIVNNTEAGTVSGGEMYYPGDSAYMTVTVNDGYRFVRWSDGGEGQQRWVKINSDSVIMAYFERDNAGTVEVQSESGLSISAASGNIVIKTPVSHVYVYDPLGREIYSGRSQRIPVPRQGIYIVNIDGMLRKIYVDCTNP